MLKGRSPTAEGGEVPGIANKIVDDLLSIEVANEVVQQIVNNSYSSVRAAKNPMAQLDSMTDIVGRFQANETMMSDRARKEEIAESNCAFGENCRPHWKTS